MWFTAGYEVFRNPIPEHDVAKLYQSADVLLLPSNSEGFGMPLLEAQAVGLPIIASNNSAIPDVVGKAGLLIDCPVRVRARDSGCIVWARPPDLEHAAVLMDSLYRDGTLREKLSEQGRMQAASRSWIVVANEVIRELSEQADRGPALAAPPPTASTWRGYFINLQRNSRRRAALLDNLKSIGLTDRYERFDAVDGHTVANTSRLGPGELGCWLSHERVLSANPGTADHLHIIEDDVVLAQDAGRLHTELLAYADAETPGWDMIFTSIFPPVSPRDHLRLAAARSTGTRLVDMRGMLFGGMFSYIVNRRSVATLVDLIEGRWRDGLPIDLYIRRLIENGLISAYVAVPFLASPVMEHARRSDIRGTVMDADQLAQILHAVAYFVDADLEQTCADLDAIIAGSRPDPLLTVYLDTLSVVLQLRSRQLGVSSSD